MKAKEVQTERMTTAGDFAAMLRALAQEHLIGLTQTDGDGEFVFSLPGKVKTFRVRVTEEA